MKLRTVRLKTSGAAACLACFFWRWLERVAGSGELRASKKAGRDFSLRRNDASGNYYSDDRVPRALMAAAVGASLAVAGALMQALTRNPLASPGVLGINAGATFFIVTASLVFSVSSMQAQMWISFAGAAASAVIVYSLGSLGKGGTGPLKSFWRAPQLLRCSLPSPKECSL
ncbi:FecCD family ABC transporter permease [Cohnella faecalis]|uniref:FecCD family ABC transporter permease n=1 Tax=Cohnella faecalis TaxID=2315694 RepID=UPI002278A3CD|nr:iron chelate uptake ABC transporter family permease subunit [Cohnella faecalis]